MTNISESLQDLVRPYQRKDEKFDTKKSSSFRVRTGLKSGNISELFREASIECRETCSPQYPDFEAWCNCYEP